MIHYLKLKRILTKLRTRPSRLSDIYLKEIEDFCEYKDVSAVLKLFEKQKDWKVSVKRSGLDPDAYEVELFNKSKYYKQEPVGRGVSVSVDLTQFRYDTWCSSISTSVNYERD